MKVVPIRESGLTLQDVVAHYRRVADRVEAAGEHEVYTAITIVQRKDGTLMNPMVLGENPNVDQMVGILMRAQHAILSGKYEES